MKNKGILEPKSETGFNEFKPGLEQGWHKKKPSPKNLPKKHNKTHPKKTFVSGLFWLYWVFLEFF